MARRPRNDPRRHGGPWPADGRGEGTRATGGRVNRPPARQVRAVAVTGLKRLRSRASPGSSLYQKAVIGPVTFSALILAALISTAMTVPLARLCVRRLGEEATAPRATDETVMPAEAGPVVEARLAERPMEQPLRAAGPVLVFDAGIGRVPVPVTKKEVVIGRHGSDDVRINDVQVSRPHARLRQLDDAHLELDNLTAVRSEPNPVLVNGVERDHAVLDDRDVVTMGGVSFAFHEHGRVLAA